MTDKETMQLALDALNMYQTTLQAVVKVTGQQYRGDPSILIQALEKALARPERRALTDAECAGIVNNNSEEIEGCVYHSPYRIISDVEEFYGIKKTE